MYECARCGRQLHHNDNLPTEFLDGGEVKMACESCADPEPLPDEDGYTRLGKGVYLAADGATRLVATDDGWEIRQSGRAVMDGIPTLWGAKLQAGKVKRRKVRCLRDRVKTELAKYEDSEAPARDLETWYDPTGLNKGVRLKREFARQWRKEVLLHPGTIRQRKTRVMVGLGKFAKPTAYYVYAYDGKDQVAVCKGAGPQNKQRLIRLGGESFSAYCRREGWSKVK